MTSLEPTSTRGTDGVINMRIIEDHPSPGDSPEFWFELHAAIRLKAFTDGPKNYEPKDAADALRLKLGQSRLAVAALLEQAGAFNESKKEAFLKWLANAPV